MHFCVVVIDTGINGYCTRLNILHMWNLDWKYAAYHSFDSASMPSYFSRKAILKLQLLMLIYLVLKEINIQADLCKWLKVFSKIASISSVSSVALEAMISAAWSPSSPRSTSDFRKASSFFLPIRARISPFSLENSRDFSISCLLSWLISCHCQAN